jgi:hypothetical protein
VVEADLRALERPLFAGRVGKRGGEVAAGVRRVREDATGSGDELLQPGR